MYTCYFDELTLLLNGIKKTAVHQMYVGAGTLLLLLAVYSSLNCYKLETALAAKIVRQLVTRTHSAFARTHHTVINDRLLLWATSVKLPLKSVTWQGQYKTFALYSPCRQNNGYSHEGYVITTKCEVCGAIYRS